MPQLDLAQLFASVARSAAQDRPYLNDLDDVGDGDAGDNYHANMQLVADTLQRQLQGGRGDVGQALLSASQALRSDGKGATAPIYAAGLADAGRELLGRTGLSLTDLLPLLEGLLRGAQGTTGSLPQGSGGLLDALVPGVLGYLDAKRRGASDADALLDALTGARQGTYSTRRQSPQVPSFGQRDTTGQIDPGAAGIGSLFEGLLRGLMQQQSQPQTQPDPAARPQQERPPTPGRVPYKPQGGIDV
jgi:hypothetical protein